MFEEAFTMSAKELIRELRNMGVDDSLVYHAAVDTRLLAALYIYVHVEAINV